MSKLIKLLLKSKLIKGFITDKKFSLIPLKPLTYRTLTVVYPPAHGEVISRPAAIVKTWHIAATTTQPQSRFDTYNGWMWWIMNQLADTTIKLKHLEVQALRTKVDILEGTTSINHSYTLTQTQQDYEPSAQRTGNKP